jgi:hypothetical protein
MDPITEHCLLAATSTGLFFFLVREFFLYLDGPKICRRGSGR